MRRHVLIAIGLTLGIAALGSTSASACDWDNCGNGCGSYGYYAAPVYYARPAYAYYAPPVYSLPRPTMRRPPTLITRLRFTRLRFTRLRPTATSNPLSGATPTVGNGPPTSTVEMAWSPLANPPGKGSMRMLATTGLEGTKPRPPTLGYRSAPPLSPTTSGQ